MIQFKDVFKKNVLNKANGEFGLTYFIKTITYEDVQYDGPDKMHFQM